MGRSSGQGQSAPFFQWLSSQRYRTDEIGRLASVATKDKTFPRSSQRLHFFLHYYDLEPANRKVIKAAHAEWRKHLKHMAFINSISGVKVS